MSDQNLKVELELDGLDKIVEGVDKAADSVESVAKSTQKQAEAAKFAVGPYQKLVALQKDYARAYREGNDLAQKDLRLLIQRTQAQTVEAKQAKEARKEAEAAAKARARAATDNPNRAISFRSPSFAQGYSDQFATSAATSAGGGGMSGGGVIALVAEVGQAVSGVIGLGLAAKNAADAINAFRSEMFQSGGTAGETASLRGINTIAGGNSAALARQFSQNISSNPTAASFAAQGGVTDFGIFDNTDKAKNLLKWAEALRTMSEAEAIRSARATGTEELLRMRDVSEQTMQNLKKDAYIQAQIYSPDQVQAAADFGANWNRLMDSIKNFAVTAGQPFLRMVNSLVEGIADFFNIASLGLKHLWEYLASIPIIGKAFGSPGDIHSRHQEANTEALKALNATMKEGFFGGGERFRSAIPGNWSGYNAGNWSGEAAKMGAFSL